MLSTRTPYGHWLGVYIYHCHWNIPHKHATMGPDQLGTGLMLEAAALCRSTRARHDMLTRTGSIGYGNIPADMPPYTRIETGPGRCWKQQTDTDSTLDHYGMSTGNQLHTDTWISLLRIITPRPYMTDPRGHGSLRENRIIKHTYLPS